MKSKKRHRLKDTASYFDVSIGLVSENIKLFGIYDKLNDYSSRNEAIKKGLS